MPCSKLDSQFFFSIGFCLHSNQFFAGAKIAPKKPMLTVLCLVKAKSPRLPKVLGKRATAPVPYKGSSKGWMIRRIFEEWLTNLNSEMKKQKH